MMVDIQFLGLLNATLQAATLLFIASLGELITEKSGILNLTRFIATKFASDKIRVNTLTLGGVYDENPSSFVKAYSKRTPLNRMAKRQEYIGPLLFLASDMSSYMTGSNLVVDGGWSAW